MLLGVELSFPIANGNENTFKNLECLSPFELPFMVKKSIAAAAGAAAAAATVLVHVRQETNTGSER